MLGVLLTLVEQRADGQRLSGGPVKVGSSFNSLSAPLDVRLLDCRMNGLEKSPSVPKLLLTKPQLLAGTGAAA